MAVAMIDGCRLALFFSPRFAHDASVGVLRGACLHVVHHVLFGHVYADPRDYPDRKARTIAEEARANEFVREPLPSDALTISQYGLPPDESTNERYERLAKPGDAYADDQDDEAQPGDGNDVVVTIDDHGMWSGAEDLNLVEDIVRELVTEAVSDVPPNSIPDEIVQALGQPRVGIDAGGLIERVSRSTDGKLNWRQLLRRYAGQILEVRPTYNRPNRRFR